jgi:hypothetical protein
VAATDGRSLEAASKPGRSADEIGVSHAPTAYRKPVIGERKGTKSPGAARRVPEFLPKDSPSVRSLEAQDEPYDAADDFSRSLDACYAAIRERVARGGEGWTPPTKSFPESSKLRASGARGASGALKQMAAPLGDAAEEVTGGYENHTTR